MDFAAELDGLFRQVSGQALATLTRVLGDFDLAQDALQEATVAALERWPVDGIPRQPGAWLLTTARRKAVDRIRRDANRDVEHRAAWALAADGGDGEEAERSSIVDDRLRLIFTC